MSIQKNFITNIDKKQFKKFFEDNFHTALGIINSEFDEAYGKFYYCHTYENLFDITGVPGCAVELGNFGVVQRLPALFGGQKVVDDFMMAKLNVNIFEQYVLFVAKNNIVDGEPLKINGLTYREAFNKAFLNYIKKLKKVKFEDEKTISCLDVAGLIKIQEIIDQKLESLEKSELELGEE